MATDHNRPDTLAGGPNGFAGPPPKEYLDVLKNRRLLPKLQDLNVHPDVTDFRDVFYEPHLNNVLPEVPPPVIHPDNVRDQGRNDPSCTGQALAALIDLQRARRTGSMDGLADPNFARVSARMLFEMARAHDEFDADDVSGSTPRGAIKGFYHNGACKESLAPFESNEGGWTLQVDMAKDARECGLGAYYRLRHILYDYHAALSEGGGILCSAMVHTGWRGHAVASNKGRIVLSGKPDLEGGHAFVLVGYDADGFFVLNSMGPDWGGVEAADGKKRPGVAHWSYEDWARHVLDAWVIRLQIPAAGVFHLTGGWDIQQYARARSGSVTTPRIHINGHYLNLFQGRFVRKGAYPSTLKDIKVIGNLPEHHGKDNTPLPYSDVLIMVDGGLDSIERSAERAAVLTPWLKGLGIYPIFVFWHNGLLERIATLFTHQAAGQKERYGSSGPQLSQALAKFGRDYSAALWNPVYEDATHSAFAGTPPDDAQDIVLVRGCAGHAWDAWAALTTSPLFKKPGMRIHLAAHSFGAILLGQLLLRAKLEAMGLDQLASLTLFAPACSVGFFKNRFGDALAPLRGKAAAGKATIYALNEDREDSDRVGPYEGSLLRYLAATTSDSQAPMGLISTGIDQVLNVRQITVGTRTMAPDLRTHRGFLEDGNLLGDFVDRLPRGQATRRRRAALMPPSELS